MSRHYDAGLRKEIIIDPEECRHLYDEIWCTCSKCPSCADIVTDEGRCLSVGACEFYEPEETEYQ